MSSMVRQLLNQPAHEDEFDSLIILPEISGVNNTIITVTVLGEALPTDQGCFLRRCRPDLSHAIGNSLLK